MQSFDPKTLTGGQLRAARALIGISADELASAALLGVATIRRAEQVDGPVRMTPANAQRIVEIMRERGLEFIAQNGGGEGVRMRRARSAPEKR